MTNLESREAALIKITKDTPRSTSADAMSELHVFIDKEDGLLYLGPIDKPKLMRGPYLVDDGWFKGCKAEMETEWPDLATRGEYYEDLGEL